MKAFALKTFGLLLALPWLQSQTPTAAQPQTPSLVLNAEEASYISELGPVRLAVDPDWEPYEWLEADGSFRGIAADLIQLIFERLGVAYEIVPTGSWTESIELSKTGKAHGLAFLNRTPAREAWLAFSEPYFSDPNVFITRVEHDYIFDPRRLPERSIVFPEGTSLEEQVRRRFPNLAISVVASEEEALRMVMERKADMTLRSLTVAAYTIRKHGLFNLKIAGQLDDLTNNFRLGFGKDYEALAAIINKGIASLSPQDVQDAINRYISIEAKVATDWTMVGWIIAGFGSFLLLGTFFYFRLRNLNQRLKNREGELVATQQKLVQYSEHLRLVIDTVPAYIYAKNDKGQFILANKLFARIFDSTPDDVIGKTNQDYGASPEETARFNAEDLEILRSGQALYIKEEQGPRPDHQPGWFQTTKIPYQHPDWDKPAILGVSIDITEQRHQAELIKHMAQHDGLTGLPNRALFSDLLKQTLPLAKRQGSKVALLFIDLDGFKPINDRYGHNAGDTVLRCVADRLQATVRQADAAGRIGGDEFVIFLTNLEVAGAAARIAEKILSSIREPIKHEGHTLGLSASIGIAVYPDHALDIHGLLQAADNAMYKAKRHKTGIEVYAND